MQIVQKTKSCLWRNSVLCWGRCNHTTNRQLCHPHPLTPTQYVNLSIVCILHTPREPVLEVIRVMKWISFTLCSLELYTYIYVYIWIYLGFQSFTDLMLFVPLNIDGALKNILCAPYKWNCEPIYFWCPWKMWLVPLSF